MADETNKYFGLFIDSFYIFIGRYIILGLLFIYNIVNTFFQFVQSSLTK